MASREDDIAFVPIPMNNTMRDLQARLCNCIGDENHPPLGTPHSQPPSRGSPTREPFHELFAARRKPKFADARVESTPTPRRLMENTQAAGELTIAYLPARYVH